MTLTEALMLLWWANEGGELKWVAEEFALMCYGQFRSTLSDFMRLRGALTRDLLITWSRTATRESRRRDIERAMREVGADS